MKYKVDYVKPSELEIDEYNVRETHVSSPELEDSIRAQGVIEPLLVRKVEGKKKLQVVCGGRRLTASIATKQKEIPVIRRDLSDMEAIAISLQENLQNDDLTSFEESEAIAKLWELMNGNKSAQQKYKEIEQMFGIGERQIRRYLSISRLSDQIKKKVKKKESDTGVQKDTRSKSKTDINTLAQISSEESWDDKQKEEAIEVASNIESSRERRKAVRELRRKAKEGKSPKQAYEEMKKRPEGRSYTVYIPYEVNKEFEEWCLENSKDYRTAIVMAIKRLIGME